MIITDIHTFNCVLVVWECAYAFLVESHENMLNDYVELLLQDKWKMGAYFIHWPILPQYSSSIRLRICKFNQCIIYLI